MTFTNLLDRYRADSSGHVAIITAIMAVPLLIGVSVAMDTNKMVRDRTNIQAALDNAAVAAITDQTISAAERAEYAKMRFWSNIEQADGVSIDVLASGPERVELKAEMKSPTFLSGMIGKDANMVRASSTTELVKGSTVCMLALDPKSARSFEVTEGATLNADCGIQVNSMNKHASVIDHGGRATAQNFCVAGGADGRYSPFVNTQCAPTDDPYEAINIPMPGQCVDNDELEELLGDWRAERDATENHAILEDQRRADAEAAGQKWYTTYFDKLHLKPGNYCGGLFLEGKEFNLDPGIYHVTGGSLVFGLGTELIGEGVTFIIHDEARIEIRDGSILNIKAPSTGPTKGLVIAQELGYKPLHSPQYPDTVSTITDGAKLNLLGTVYLPSHKIEFLGGSLSKTRAPATSFIAHQISTPDFATLG